MIEVPCICVTDRKPPKSIFDVYFFKPEICFLVIVVLKCGNKLLYTMSQMYH